MIVENYGIEFQRLNYKTLELLRQWRNSDSVTKFMVYHKFITPQMQKEWFEATNNINNYYFIVKCKGRYIGMLNLRDVNWGEKLAEPGGFISLEKFRASRVAAEALLLLLELAFKFMKIENLTGTVLKSNTRFVQTNFELGGVVVGEDEYSYRINISKERFEKKGAKFLEAARRFHKSDTFSVSFSDDDESSGLKDELLEKLKHYPELINNKMVVVG